MATSVLDDLWQEVCGKCRPAKIRSMIGDIQALIAQKLEPIILTEALLKFEGLLHQTKMGIFFRPEGLSIGREGESGEVEFQEPRTDVLEAFVAGLQIDETKMQIHSEFSELIKLLLEGRQNAQLACQALTLGLVKVTAHYPLASVFDGLLGLAARDCARITLLSRPGGPSEAVAWDGVITYNKAQPPGLGNLEQKAFFLPGIEGKSTLTIVAAAQYAYFVFRRGRWER